ncbi:MAG: hypothetical protein EYC70_00175 [Planctomycetota bacterium]|nr:MAG: hypothetical protein EYC70_00175 [Planctomycetota bacterium]
MTVFPALISAILAISGAFPGQEQPDPARARLLERLGQLPPPEQAELAQRVYRSVLQSAHPVAAAAARLEGDPALAALPVLEAEPARAFDADEYAPALGLRTRVLRPSEAAWKKAEKQYFGAGKVPEHGAHWSYDHGRNALLRPLPEQTPEQIVAALYAGRWPHPGRLQALAEAALDHDASMDAASDYFNHAYRDRSGRVYSGMRLYELWNSGKEIEISDVEAIAWLRTVAGDRSVSSPIPAKKHAAIYQRIAQSFQSVREYQTLRQALAARCADPQGALPLLFSGEERSIDQVWALADHDPAAVRALLQQFPGREAFLLEIARQLREPPCGAPELARRLAARADLEQAVAAAAAAALESEGLLGIGRR